MVGKLGREAREGGVLTCSQSRGTTVVFQLGDPPHPEFWRLRYPVCVYVYTHVCISVTYSTSNLKDFLERTWGMRLIVQHSSHGVPVPQSC